MRNQRAGGHNERQRSIWREYAEALGMAILLALFIRTFIVQAFKIPSGSMLPTLQVGDHLLVNKFIYGVRIPLLGKRLFAFHQPERGDVIVFIYPQDRSKDFIKRVIGLPGERVEIKNKVVYINGKKIPDPHAYYQPIDPRLARRPRDNFGPYEVPPGHVFVLGDNRDHSHDSRFWGSVPINDILGKAFILYWSWDSGRFRPRWSRIGMRIR
ncbi:MAG: signal peptidase I [Candidatus Dadabacteria bacterium]|nr:MAG: signal peptidase I [Candidatus Dadabacteria bacterium]